MEIITYAILEKEMSKICEEVILKVSDMVMKNLKDTIRRDIYESHSPNKIYKNFSESESEFYNAWEWEKIESGAKNISREMVYMWQKMSVQPQSYIHTDYLTGQDSRSRLAEILNVNGFDMGVNGQGNPLSVRRYSYWNNLIVDLFLSGTLLGYFDKAFAQYEIKR